ncbi:transcription antitermination factor NusB, partial [bacterium]|nr:transcription antitermination factor NusB [bacterium]
PENKYFYKNIEIHGITPEITKSAPTFDRIYPTIQKYLNNNLVVSHNAAFDMDVLAKTMDFYGLANDDLDFDFCCTLNIYGGGLKECCKEFNIPLMHHDPLSDAEACAQLFVKAKNEDKRNTPQRFGERYFSKSSAIDDTVSQQSIFKNEAIKAINTLKGILLGILMDKTINDKEINEFQQWSENQYYLIDHHPFKELMQLITETTDVFGFDVPIVIDMFNICQEFQERYYNHTNIRNVEVLNGIFHGILADGIVKDIEDFELEKRLSENEHLTKLHPYDEVYSIVKTILNDRQIDEDERKRLKSFIYDFVELANSEIDQQIKDEISEIPLHGICTINPEITFEGKLFCLSGNFEHGEKQYIEDFFAKVLLKNEFVFNEFEEQSIYWNDDLDFVVSMVIKTLKKFREDSIGNDHLSSLYKDDEDEGFTVELFRKTLSKSEENRKTIEAYTKNWDVERVATMDILIMELALTELTEFPSVPIKVSLNEYIELAKYYSTQRSSIFINGVLDRITRDFKEQQKIVKTGRGLIEG